METVFDALKAIRSASTRLAARLDISREEVLNELWELKRNGVHADKTGHTWFLAGEGESGVTEEQPAQSEVPGCADQGGETKSYR
ncbi:hypothetical protein ACLB1R_10820 [Escherichia coli]